MPLITAYTLSPALRASSRRFNTIMPMPSPRMVPSPDASKGRASPVGDSAGVLLKHMNMKMSLKQSEPPVTAMSASPVCSSMAAMCMAESELAHAASTTQLVPPRLKRFATRPATTLPSSPGKELSCHGTKPCFMRSTMASARAGSSPASSRALRQTGWLRRAPSGMASSSVPVTPSMTLVRSRFHCLSGPQPASRRAASTASRAKSWALSVASMALGAMPNFEASKPVGGRKPPRFA